MKAAYYERNGTARDVLKVGDVETPRPGPGEVRVKLAVSGVNPSDVKSRQGSTRKIAYPRVIPHSDGAGVIDEVGDGVSKTRVGERVWYGTASGSVLLAQPLNLSCSLRPRRSCYPKKSVSMQAHASASPQ